MISSNERHMNTNSIFILITEVNQHVTGETDEERCFARQYLHFWGEKKRLYSILVLSTMVHV